MVPAEYPPGPAHDLIDAERREEVGEGEIFATGDEVHLVDGVGDLAAIVDGDDGVVIAGAKRRGRIAFDAHHACEQNLPVGHQMIERDQSVGFFRDQERHHCFRPDDQLRPRLAGGGRRCAPDRAAA